MDSDTSPSPATDSPRVFESELQGLPRRPVLQLNGVTLSSEEQNSLDAVIVGVFNRQFAAEGVDFDAAAGSNGTAAAAAAYLPGNTSTGRLTVVNLIRGTVASIGEAPLSFHQATMFFCLRDDYPPAWKAAWIGASYIMVVTQCLSALTLLLATFTNSCRNNKGCNTVEGQFCSPTRMRCLYCGDMDLGYGAKLGSVDDLSAVNATEFCTHHVAADPLRPMTDTEAMCVFDRYEDTNGCRHPNNPESWMPNHDGTHCIEIVVAMHISDWIVLTLCSTLVALTMSNELRDMKLAQIAMAKMQFNSGVRSAWRFPLDGLNILRQYTMLPTIVFSVTAIILHMGGDAITVCFNTVRESPVPRRSQFLIGADTLTRGWAMQVAVLFLMEMDVSHRTHTRFRFLFFSIYISLV